MNTLRVFEAVATRLNFSDAAEALHVTPAAVSQQIKALEDYLQTPLLRRQGRGVQLTLVAADLQAGRLVLASERALPHRFAYYFVCPEAYLSLPKVAALRMGC